MFSPIRAEVEDRVLSIQQVLAALKRLDADSTTPPIGLKSLKGACFVHFYALYEYTLVSAMQAAMRQINASAIQINSLRSELLALTLDDLCQSMADCGIERKWSSRATLMQMTRSSAPVSAPESVFPADGSHFRVQQIRTIWALFGIGEPPVPDSRLLGRVNELVELRNAIAHGRIRADVIGAGFSVADLEQRLSDAAEICRHIVNTMESHVMDRSKLVA